jgi:hypothetical protein
MKKLICILLPLLICLVNYTIAQETYQKIYDDPADVIKGHIAVEYYGVDVGFKNTAGAMIFVAGVNGSYPLSDKLVVEGALRVPLLRFEKQGFGFILDGGGMLVLNSKTTEDDVTVVLGYKEEDIGMGYERRTTKYVKLNGSVKRSVVLRGGIYLKNGAVDYKEGFTSYVPDQLFHKGIYVGIGKQRQYFFQLQRDSRGNKVNFGAGSIFRPYIDVMVLPVSVKLKQETLGMGEGTPKELSGLVGARAGFRWYRNAFTRKQNSGHRIPFFGNSVVTLEAGMRPIDGLFINGGISYILHKF